MFREAISLYYGIMDLVKHKAGYVAILGKPNVGKSTLMNALVGQKLSIITPKAQTTRHRILGIFNDELSQIIFSDTPGVILPKYGLQKAMMQFVLSALEDADLVLFVADVLETFPEDEILKIVKQVKQPVFLILNKCDLATDFEKEDRKDFFDKELKPADFLEISALKGTNLDVLIDKIKELLPYSPPYYDKEAITDKPERFFTAEIIREKIFLNYYEELPYSTEVQILDFKEEPDIIRIEAEIHVERRNHKGIIIGKKGESLKKLGTEAREDLEAFFDKKVFVNLYVRVAENWKNSDRYLKNFGYSS